MKKNILLLPLFSLYFVHWFSVNKLIRGIITYAMARLALSEIIISCDIFKINDIFLAEDEIIYCELLQKLNCCHMATTVILAQYLGQLNDILFPPNVCSNDGVDLLMRRTKDFPVSTYKFLYVMYTRMYLVKQIFVSWWRMFNNCLFKANARRTIIA